MTIVNLPIPNPDSASRAEKTVVDISFSTTDVAASGLSSSIKPNYSNTGNVIVISRDGTTPVVSGSTYFTPLYRERFNYRRWSETINPIFVELD